MGNIRWGGQGKLRGTVNDNKNGDKCKLHGKDSKVPVNRSRNELGLVQDEKGVSAAEVQKARTCG